LSVYAIPMGLYENSFILKRIWVLAAGVLTKTVRSILTSAELVRRI